MADVNRLVFAIQHFLLDQIKEGNLSEEQVESLEVATQCLEAAYGINTQDPEMVAKYQVDRNLLDIFNAQVGVEVESGFPTSSLHEPTLEDKDQAEALKNKGNDFMKVEKFSDALESYTQALKLDNKNAVYYCNRAAAYSKLNNHQQAIEDCKKALSIDPQYSKAYGRMGIAYTAQDDHESAVECYQKALELDPGNQSYMNNLEIAEQKLREQVAAAGFSMGPMGAGNFDLRSMLNNPAIMNMAQNFMTNPQMQQMMAQMMSGASQQQSAGSGGVGGGGGGSNSAGAPDGLSGLLHMGQQLAQQMQQQNPELVEQLKRQFKNSDNKPPGSGGNSGGSL
ncbi:hypothetical protein ACJMK2_040599 [Sinanodonta woodiana]|uniref:SGTA homodimerisation domain-containing protein n=1 Tax=Sinanodonta woodiana TaxID=1069815 RepID=A0ABD3W1I8_SINWO